MPAVLSGNPEIACEEPLKYVKGPDFPTGGIIYGYEGVREALLTGRGRVVMRARTEIEHTAKAAASASSSPKFPIWSTRRR